MSTKLKRYKHSGSQSIAQVFRRLEDVLEAWFKEDVGGASYTPRSSLVALRSHGDLATSAGAAAECEAKTPHSFERFEPRERAFRHVAPPTRTDLLQAIEACFGEGRFTATEPKLELPASRDFQA